MPVKCTKPDQDKTSEGNSQESSSHNTLFRSSPSIKIRGHKKGHPQATMNPHRERWNLTKARELRRGRRKKGCTIL